MADRIQQPSASSKKRARAEDTAPRRGVKQRIEIAEDEDVDMEPHAQASSSRGMLKRLGVDDAIAAEKAASSSISYSFMSDKYPFTKSIVTDWAKGLVSSEKLLERCTGACEQGASGVGKLERSSSKGFARVNAHRDAVRAIGWPPSAPPAKWIKIPLLGGMKAPHTT